MVWPLPGDYPGDGDSRLAQPASTGTLPTHGALFIGLLTGTVLLVGALTFIPALALGPVAEHLSFVK
ncbi:Potassium-transporting ATPase A chain (TC 3.A.3.7.1) [Cronobacter universalis NCTC 9529]|nr:Potassium-transporting ATPase A chain (TC 3.A.3.7.1) [Cronobacter universalis NCTC 9529]